VLALGRNHLGAALQNPDKFNWARQETFYAGWTALALAMAIVGVAHSRTRWIRTGCLCGTMLVCVIDLYHAYGSFHHGHSNPDTYYSMTDEFLQPLKEYRQQHGPYRCAQLFHDRLAEELTMPRNLPYFLDYLEVPEGYTSFFLDSVSRFQGITNEAAKIHIQNVRLLMQLDPENHVWVGPTTKSFSRARFFSRIQRYSSEPALLAALEHGDIDWQHEAAIGEWPAARALRGDQQSQASDSNNVGRFSSLSPESYSITYNVSAPGILFVSQAFYPGWVVSDKRCELVKVFGAFQGIVIPEAGRGQVAVRFSPPSLKWGLAITLISIAIAVSLASRKWDVSSTSD